MSLIDLENSIGSITGLLSEAGTYLGALLNSSPVQVFKTIQGLAPITIDGLPDSVPVTAYAQAFQNAQIIRCNVRASSKTMDHPIETGQIISDYKIILPVEISLPVIVKSEHYRDTYAEIFNLYNNSELLIVQSRASNFSNMIITDMPDEERGDMFNVITIELRLKQVLLVQAASNYAPADPTQTNTQSSGQQQAAATTLPENSVTNNSQVVQSWAGHVHDIPE